MKLLNRREFVKSTLGAAAALTVLPVRKSIAANEKVIIGVMGLGGRGTYLAERFANRPDAEVAYLCDPDTRRFARARNVVEEAQEKMPKMVQDFRKILDDKSVDVLINATPDHWHALGTILAMHLRGGPWEKFLDFYKRLGLPVTSLDIGLSEKSYIQAVLKAPHMRKGRYTILDELDLDEKLVKEALSGIKGRLTG